MNETIFDKATRLAAAWHSKALNMPRRDCFAPTRSCSIDGLAAEIDRDRDLVEALKGTTLPIATGEDFKFWEDLLFAAGYVRDQILLVLDDGRAVVEAGGKAIGHLEEIGGRAIGHRMFLADDPQVVTTDDTGEEVRFQYGADLPESVYVEGDAVFLEFTGRMPAHLHVAGDLSVDRAAANMLPAGTLVGNGLYIFEFLSDVGPIRLPDGLKVNGDVHLPETSEVVFGDRTEICGDIFGGSDNPFTVPEWSADLPVPSTGPELSRFALAMESCVEGDVFRSELPAWLSKTPSAEGQAFVIDEGEFRGWVLAVSGNEVLGLDPRSWCRCIAALHLADGSSLEEVADRLDRACRFESEHSLGGIHEVLYLSDLPMELPEGFDKDEAVIKGVVMCRSDGSCVVDTDDGFEATTLAELGLVQCRHEGSDVPQGKVVQMREWKFRTLVNNANTCAAALERLKRDYPVPDDLDGYVEFAYEIVAYDRETGIAACDEVDHYSAYFYDEIARNLYKSDIVNFHNAEDLTGNIERYVRLGGTFDGSWDCLDIVPIEGGWRINLLDGPDEGAVIEVVNGKATVLEVDLPTENEVEQVGLSLTRPHDGGVPI